MGCVLLFVGTTCGIWQSEAWYCDIRLWSSWFQPQVRIHRSRSSRSSALRERFSKSSCIFPNLSSQSSCLNSSTCDWVNSRLAFKSLTSFIKLSILTLVESMYALKKLFIEDSCTLRSSLINLRGILCDSVASALAFSDFDRERVLSAILSWPLWGGGGGVEIYWWQTTQCPCSCKSV